jgi:hypothetical protein
MGLAVRGARTRVLGSDHALGRVRCRNVLELGGLWLVVRPRLRCRIVGSQRLGDTLTQERRWLGAGRYGGS